MSVEFQPLIANVLIRVEPEPELSRVIAVQRSLEGLCRYGEILATGPEVRDVKVGQRVIASITAGTEMAQGTLIPETAILGILHE